MSFKRGQIFIPDESRWVTVRQLFKVLPLGDKQAQELVITPTILLITQRKATSELELPNTSVNKGPKLETLVAKQQLTKSPDIFETFPLDFVVSPTRDQHTLLRSC